MHIDVNNAFLSWEALKLLSEGYDKDIRTLEAIIGGDEESRHGIVLAKSTPAKKKGIKTAMSLYEARKIIPNILVFKPHYSYYQKRSDELFELIGKYTPDIEKFSIDECFIEYTYVAKLYGDPIKFAYKLKEEIKNKLGFTVNIGIANNKLCAKMASDFEKPDKVHTLFKEEVKDKMFPMDVGELLWIGKKTKEKLNQIGIHTIGDLASSKVENLRYYFKNQTEEMIKHANGIDDSLVITKERETACISKMITIDHDVFNKLELHKYLNHISNELGLQLRLSKKYTNTIAIILKNQYFKMSTHQVKLDNPTNVTSKIYEVSKKLLDEAWHGEAIRLVGIRLDNLSLTSSYQHNLFEETNELVKESKIDDVCDTLKNKYGYNIINKASLLPKKDKL